MTSTSQKPDNSGTITDEKEAVIVIPVSAIRKARGLSGSQYDLWLYLYECDRYGKGVEIPPPEDIGKELGCHARTIFRNSQRLVDRELFEFEIKRWKAYNVRAKAYFSKNSTDKEIHLSDNLIHFRTNRSQNGQFDPSPNLEPAQDKGSENGQCTNNRSKRSLKQTIGTSTPPTHPVPEADIDRKEFGTTQDLEALSALINEAGVPPNKTIQGTLATLLSQEGAAARQIVENAISSLKERQEQGTVRNPGGFIVAALRRHFTANQAKKLARVHRQEPPSFNQVSVTINQALARGDRSFALARLQQLWSEGHQDLVEELCTTWKRDWEFSITTQGVRDGGLGDK